MLNHKVLSKIRLRVSKAINSQQDVFCAPRPCCKSTCRLNIALSFSCSTHQLEDVGYYSLREMIIADKATATYVTLHNHTQQTVGVATLITLAHCFQSFLHN